MFLLQYVSMWIHTLKVTVYVDYFMLKVMYDTQ